MRVSGAMTTRWPSDSTPARMGVNSRDIGFFSPAVQAAGTRAATRAIARCTAERALNSSYQRATFSLLSKRTPANSRRHSQPNCATSAML